MGMGSGTGSKALASLYPALDVIGVDLDPTMVELANERYKQQNLGFVVGDIAKRVFPEESLQAVVDSSVLHHVTSFTDYSYEAARQALEVQRDQVALHGVVIVRDFLAPEHEVVFLDLPADDGDESSDLEKCSTAHLFEVFSLSFRSLHQTPGFPLQARSRRLDSSLSKRLEALSNYHAFCHRICSPKRLSPRLACGSERRVLLFYSG